MNKQFTSCGVCSSIVRLTSQGSVGQLQAEIKAVLEAISGVVRYRGFDVCGAVLASQDSLSLNAYIVQQAAADEVMADEGIADIAMADQLMIAQHALARQALLTKKVQYCIEDQCWMYFVPVQYMSSNQGLWFIECEVAMGIEALKTLALLVNGYQNCASHIGLQNTDALTGLENRHALSARLNSVLTKNNQKLRATDQADACMPTLCLLDIDFFKRVNDDYGHLYGDEVLLLFSTLMKQSFRDCDFLYRYGGEEFIVLVANVSHAEAFISLNRFRQAVSGYVFPQVGHITVSSGFVAMKPGMLPSSIVDQADCALYYAKEHGRNQVASYDELIEKKLIKKTDISIESELF